jgi:phosphatidylinositol 4-kinase
LGDSYAYRKELCTKVFESARKWLHIALTRAPLEVPGLLQEYLAEFNRYPAGGMSDVAHMGRALALEIGKATSKNELSIGKIKKKKKVQ